MTKDETKASPRRTRTRAPSSLDEGVKRALGVYWAERDPDLARVALRRECARLSAANRKVLAEHLAEVSLGQLHVLICLATRDGQEDSGLRSED
ncbi:MAG: hypothetical protein IPK13_25845 [Deltaproteobacteria bacterium]|nr:hypothetical protein [Deltaproteobacteria bacterium]